ncbi:Calx-beta domain-containing protein [Poseidonibacter lekithochrous]|uniref:Calx-beta domain-containing protein n=1 Tax=Poseidonibacter lekithochrous TaxID=1904463 RepID=UPI0008FC206E|nr:Calx-beta domain-containing protein [Poseidonibacter lekithochrous]
MKLTIKLENGSIKVVELNKDLEFTVAKGEQYVFSNGFTNYVLNFKDDQESIVLVFNIDGKSVQVVLNGIVPHLQDNIPGMDSPTAVIINKNVDDESLDTIMENTAFNGSEILDQLALLSSKPIELGVDGDDSLSLITSFESLVGSLGAAAAGPDAGGDTNSDGSTFNTIFGNIDDPLSPIATSDSWVNLPESISSTGIETDGTPVIPTISISDSTVNETAGQISFVITLDQATTNTVLVNYSTLDGTALSGLDYTASAGSIIFLPGEVSKTINIPVNNDNIYEISENLLINLDAPINATITDGQATGTIIDTNLPAFSIQGVEVIEGEYAVFTVDLDSASARDITISLATKDGSATSNDYLPQTEILVNGSWVDSSTVTIPAGDISVQVRVKTLNDALKEPLETFDLEGTLSSGLTSNTTASGTSSISDNNIITSEDTALVSIAGEQTIVEGETSTAYTVSVDQPAADVTSPITVEITYSGVAADGKDFTKVASVTIPAGSNSVDFNITTLDDVLAEGSEVFTMTIGAITDSNFEHIAAKTGANSVDTTIVDDKDPDTTEPTTETALVSIAGEQTIVEGETSTAYTVSVDQPAADVTSPITVEITYSGVAADGKDFTKVASVTIPAGSNSVDFNITTLDDVLAEGSEVFTMTIGAITDSNFEHIAAKTGANSVDTTIVDNDSLSMNIDSVQVDEDALLGTDDLDNYDPDIKEFTGSLGLNVENVAEVNLMFEGGQSTSLTSKGEMIDINYSNNNETIKGVSKDGREIFEITLDESTGEYTFKLKDVVDHPDVTSEDLISNIDFNVIAVRGSDITASKINISIADDIPTANTVVIDADSQYTETTTNIVIGIDTSGSMGTTKMNLAKEAAIKLIEKYEQMGNVNVKVVEFNTNASATTWFTDSQSAKDSINGLSAGGYTNYEDTLRQTIDTFDTNSDPKPSADQDIFYMLSDGDPTKGDMNGSDGISGIVPEWKTFAENNFDDVYSIGIGTNVDLDGNSRGSLDQIADVANGHDTFVVKNVNELTDELLATIVNVNGVLVINTGGNELDFSFGADGPADGSGPKLDGGKLSFTWGDGDLSDGSGVIINNGDGTGPNLVWTVFNNGKVILGKDATSGQILVKIEANNVNSDNPTYEVTQFVPNTGITKVEVPFTVVDGDGDGATANLSIDIDSNFKAFVKLSGDSTVAEANGATLEHTLSLVDQNGTAINLREGQVVTVELKYENDSTESNDFTSAKTVTAVITGTAGGVNTVQIINNIQNDSVYEGDESYTLSIESISSNVAGLGTIFAHETNGVKDSVTGTITDEFDNIKAEVSIVDSDDINTVVDASSGTVETAKITGAINFGDTITKLVVTNGSQKVEIDPANVTVQPDGTFTIENVDVSTLNDGVLTVELEVQNSSGNTASDTDTVSKDTISEISITSASIDHMTGLASGTVTDVEPGRTISIKFIDDGGYEVRTTTTVKPDGTWEISEDVSSLTHGNIKIGVFVNDNAGNPGQTCEEDIGVLNTVIANDDYGKDVEQGEIVIAKAVNADQGTPDITYLEDGGYVVVWEEVNGASYNGAEYNNDTESTQWATRENHDIFSQRFDKDGEPVGDAIQVNTHDARDQHDANVTALPNGRYLVTWTSDDDYINVDNYDNSSRYIKARIYDEHNNPVCNEFTVARAEYDPIVGLPDGGFIVTWSADARHNNTDQGAQDNPIHSDVHDGSEYGVFGQRYDEFGNAMGDKFQINTHTLNDQMDSDITLDSNGDVVITWQSENQDGSSYGIYTQKFELTSNGVTKVGDEKQVNTTTNGSQTDPEITALTDGKAVITWESGTDVYAQILDENGAKVGMELDVTTSSGVQSNPVVTAISTGFIITWQSNENGNHDIYSQRFNSSGSEIGDKVKVNSSDISDQVEPTITTLSDGGYIIAWQNGDNISAQRFNADGTTYKVNSLDLDEDTSITIDVADLMANDTDPESHNFKITAVSNAQNGTVVLNDTNNDGTYDSVTFTPNEDYNGPATFVYTLTDEKGAVDTATVHLDVKPKGEPSVFVGTLCDADVKGHDITVNEGEDAILAVRVSGAEAGTTLSLTLSDGTALNTVDYNSTFYYAFVSDSTDMNNITWIEYTGAVNVPEDSSRLIVKTVTVDDSNDEVNELYNLTATLSTGETNTGTVTIVDNDEPGTPPEANDRHIDLDCSTDTYTAGLKSEYYGVDSQIHNLTEFKAIVSANDPDATFTATNINYGYGTGSVGLGTNLQTFLKGDASSLSNDPADSSDAGIKLYGKVFLAAGTYNFKVYSDDGYDIKVNGQNVADFESNQSPGTKVHDEFTIAEDGYYDIEMLWWDQGGAYVFQPQISSDGGATYKFLDSSMLFTEDTSSNDETAIEFKMEDFVSDVEDDASSTIVKIRIDSLPEDGVLTVNGTAVKVGDIYDETAVIKYTANSNIEDTLYGTTADSGTLAEWGTITNGVITTADGNATIKAYNNGVIGEVGFSSENNNNSHDGLGLGVVSPDGDDDQIEGSSGEKLVVEFKEIVTNAEIGLSSLGTYFTSDSIDSKAHWVAFKNGVEVASGDVQQSTGDSNDTTNSFKIDTEFDKIEFTSVSTLNANYSIQYMNIDYKVDDSFDYVAIDSDNRESESAKVTIDLETTGCTIRDHSAESTDLSLVLGQATVIDGGSRDLPDVTQTHPIGVVLGDQKGDSNIYGSTPSDYDESYSKLLNFGIENAGKTVTLSMDVTINGSWNYGSGYYDDNWSVFVNSEQKAIYKYSSDNGSNPDDYTEVTNNGVTQYRYGNSGENSNISNFTHTTIPIVVTLNAQGKANVVLAASSTEKAEKVTINSITSVLDGGVEELPDTYVYPIDIAAVLSDTDGSETLTVRLEGVPSSAVFTSSMTLTDKGNGIWEIEIPAGQKSIDADITMRISESDNDFNLVAIAKSTESENSSETETMTFSDETIDLESIAKPSYEIDTLDLENNIRQTISLDLDDVIDLTDSDNELVIKGDLSDKVDLDNTEWTNSGTQEIDGSNYNVYTGLGANSTVKLLIDDDIEITPDI